ncbi:MAG: sugar phosphate isomerase/epimerase [Candidatus Omnitrophica bacterium]|nr:sugar phosphate isomerase/epimerase [Candidatus Omnitrophota bacterium]
MAVSPALTQAGGYPNELYVGGFLVGPQAYTFNRFSFFEAVDKAKEAGASVIEAYPGQRLAADDERPFSHDAPPAVWAKAKMKLEKTGVRLVNYGVVGLGSTEESMRKVFDFAKIMSIPCITTEPGKEEDFDLIEKMVKEYDIKIAIHNHPKPSKYWDPNYVLQCIKDRDPRIGACADTGHWARSGVQPLEALKILEGRIVSSHLKDLNEFGERDAHDVHWGEGVCHLKEILDEYRRQGFNGNISIEYEYNWENNVGDVAACIDYIREYGKNN